MQQTAEVLAVATLAPSLNAEVSPLAGRAPYFVVFGPGTTLVEWVENDFAQDEKTAGARAAYLVSSLGVDCLVAGEVGPRMHSVLSAEDVCFVASEGRAADAAAELLASRMQQSAR